MNLKHAWLAASLAACTLLAAAPARAHHAFSAEFDASRPIKLQGTITQMEWVNPHGWIHLEVREPGRETTGRWTIEVATPNTLLRRGLRKADLLPGAPITIEGFRSKDDRPRAHGTYVTLADGRRVFLSSALANFGDDQR